MESTLKSTPQKRLLSTVNYLVAKLNILYSGKKATKSESNSETFLNEQITNTPFRIVGTQKDGYFIAMGLSRLTNTFKTAKEAKDEMHRNPWDITAAMIIAIYEQIKNLEKGQTETSKETKQTEMNFNLANDANDNQ